MFLLPREGEKVAAKLTDEGASRRLAAAPGFILNLTPSSVDCVDTFSPSRGRRETDHFINSRAMITRMISLVPSRIWFTRTSRTMRSIS